MTTVSIGTAAATDDVSAAANITIANDAPAEFPLGTTVVTWTATDEAGNSASAPQNVTVEDTTAPTLAIPADVTAQATGPLTTVAIGTASASDFVDGFGCCSPTNDSPGAFPPGETTVTWTATDAAGNASTATQTVTVLYAFSGFEPPIDALPTVNAGKAGQMIPVKWNIPDGSGGFIRDLGVVSSVNFQNVVCDSDNLESDMDLVEAESGGSGLRYDTTDEHFVFNWKTSKGMRGQCFVLILTLNDGTQHLAKFSLK